MPLSPWPAETASPAVTRTAILAEARTCVSAIAGKLRERVERRLGRIEQELARGMPRWDIVEGEVRTIEIILSTNSSPATRPIMDLLDRV